MVLNCGDVIYSLENLGIEPTGRFGLTDIVTREEVVVMISKAIRLSGTIR